VNWGEQFSNAVSRLDQENEVTSFHHQMAQRREQVDAVVTLGNHVEVG